MIVAFTGHRPNKLPGGYDFPYKLIGPKISRVLKELQPEKCISGMALGVDQVAAGICILLDIPFIAAVPFEGQESKWPEQSQLVYRKLLERAAEVKIVCDGGYEIWKMQKRNEYLVDNCDVLIAVWDGTAGGTGNCVKYAEKKGKRIIRINPKELK